MDSPQHCQEQATECLRLMNKAQSKDEAQVLRNISSSWSRLAGQIDRYTGIVRDQSRRSGSKAATPALRGADDCI